MKTIKDFLKQKPKVYCNVCGKEITRVCKLNIRSSDPMHVFTNSKRPVPYTYNLKLCSGCFKKFIKITNDFIQNK